MTKAAVRAEGRYPYSPRAQSVLAIHNGVRVEQMPEDWRYAANYRMQAWMDLLGAAMEAGKPHRDPDGRWWTPRRLLSTHSEAEV